MKTPAPRKYYVGEALSSYRRLNAVLADLTEPEVLHCLELEAGSQRRRIFIDRLIARACRLRELETKRQLEEKFHAT